MFPRSLLLSIVCLWCIPGLAYAYLDPGSGSMFLQLILAGFAGFIMFWRRIKDFVIGLVKREGPDSKSKK